MKIRVTDPAITFVMPETAIKGNAEPQIAARYGVEKVSICPMRGLGSKRIGIRGGFRQDERINQSQLQISPEAKLTLLQRLDRWRRWKSLDDRRLCLGCGRVITGHEIEVASSEGLEITDVRCPTPACQSIPLDWILPG